MWIEEQVMRRDLDRLLKAPLPWSKLDGKTVLVTGATGLIGSAVVNGLLYYGLQTQNPPQVLALVRSEEKAQRMLGAQLVQCPNLRLVTGDVTSLELPEEDVDYIIHAASQTASRAMVESRWAMTKTVRSRIRASMPLEISFSVRVSMEEVASSSTMMGGSATAALAMASSCRWPWDRLAPSPVTMV